MSILSNYVPNCIVRAEVSAREELAEKHTQSTRFCRALCTSSSNCRSRTFRAVTHNKGIMNGATLLLATGNDFRAVEAGIHAYAAKSGQYSSLSHAKIENGVSYSG
jgi:hydroxymethylglutaryl-CoA reductase